MSAMAVSPLFAAAPPVPSASGGAVPPILPAVSRCAARVHDVSDFLCLYRLRRALGRGSYSVVYEVVHRRTGERWAAKLAIPKRGECPPNAALTQSQVREIAVALAADHPNLAPAAAVFVCDAPSLCAALRPHLPRLEAAAPCRGGGDGGGGVGRWLRARRVPFVLVMECLAGGDVFARVAQRPLEERAAADVMRHVLRALSHLHARRLVHRDVKTENIVMDAKGRARLIDYGFVAAVPDGAEGLTQFCGSHHYVAPEVVRAVTSSAGFGADGKIGYGAAADVWSAGVAMHVMLHAAFPFHHKRRSRLLHMIGTGEPPRKPASGLSRDAKDLLRRLLTFEAHLRPTAAEALQHPWFTTRERNGEAGGRKESLNE